MTAKDVKIRSMETKDLDEVIDLGIITSEIKTGTDSPQFYSKDTLLQWIQSRNGILLAARKDAELVGFAITAYNPDSRDGYLHCIVIKEEFRRKHIGGQMLRITLRQLQKWGCNHVYSLTTDSNGKTLEFLRAHGFQVGKEFHYVDRVLRKREILQN